MMIMETSLEWTPEQMEQGRASLQAAAAAAIEQASKESEKPVERLESLIVHLRDECLVELADEFGVDRTTSADKAEDLVTSWLANPVAMKKLAQLHPLDIAAAAERVRERLLLPAPKPDKNNRLLWTIVMVVSGVLLIAAAFGGGWLLREEISAPTPDAVVAADPGETIVITKTVVVTREVVTTIEVPASTPIPPQTTGQLAIWGSAPQGADLAGSLALSGTLSGKPGWLAAVELAGPLELVAASTDGSNWTLNGILVLTEPAAPLVTGTTSSFVTTPMTLSLSVTLTASLISTDTLAFTGVAVPMEPYTGTLALEGILAAGGPLALDNEFRMLGGVHLSTLLSAEGRLSLQGNLDIEIKPRANLVFSNDCLETEPVGSWICTITNTNVGTVDLGLTLEPIVGENIWGVLSKVGSHQIRAKFLMNETEVAPPEGKVWNWNNEKFLRFSLPSNTSASVVLSFAAVGGDLPAEITVLFYDYSQVPAQLVQAYPLVGKEK